jgi:hypothetical protein
LQIGPYYALINTKESKNINTQGKTPPIARVQNGYSRGSIILFIIATLNRRNRTKGIINLIRKSHHLPSIISEVLFACSLNL